MVQGEFSITPVTDIKSPSGGLTFGIGKSESSSDALTQPPKLDRSRETNVNKLTAMNRGTGTPGEGDPSLGDLPGSIVDTVA